MNGGRALSTVVSRLKYEVLITFDEMRALFSYLVQRHAPETSLKQIHYVSVVAAIPSIPTCSGRKVCLVRDTGRLRKRHLVAPIHKHVIEGREYSQSFQMFFMPSLIKPALF